ncbi:MAG: tetratricopeptide repeat protein, partial [Maritimibacter sp.]|nr:tetratricopeptide repeat protein [Maritimibacter sp.]
MLSIVVLVAAPAARAGGRLAYDFEGVLRQWPLAPHKAQSIVPVQDRGATDYARWLQQDLATLGFYQGAIDGIAGDATTDALVRFYRASPLTSGDFDTYERDVLRKAAMLFETGRHSLAAALAKAPELVAAWGLRERALAANDAGDIDTAVDLEMQEFTAMSGLLGGDHPTTLEVQRNLDGFALMLIMRGSQALDAGENAEAEALYRKSLEISKHMRADSPHELAYGALQGIAISLFYQKKLVAAEDYYERAWKVAAQMFGPDDPTTLDALTFFANDVFDQGRYSDAEGLYRDLLDAKIRTKGGNDLETLEAMSFVAKCVVFQGRYAEAEALYRQDIAGRRLIQDALDPGMLAAQHNLANAILGQGRFAEAETLFRRVAEARKTVSGNDHPETLKSLAGLASALEEQGRYELAEEINREVLESRIRLLGNENIDTSASLHNLANTVFDQRRYSEAEQLYRRAVDVRNIILGPLHPETLESMQSLANCLSAQGKKQEAESRFREILVAKQQALGFDHPSTLLTLGNLASVVSVMENAFEASALWRRALEGYSKTLGEGHPRTLSALDRLAIEEANTGRYRDAFTTWQRGFAAAPAFFAADYGGSAGSRNAMFPLSVPAFLEAASWVSSSERGIAARSFEAQGWLTF